MFCFESSWKLEWNHLQKTTTLLESGSLACLISCQVFEYLSLPTSSFSCAYVLYLGRSKLALSKRKISIKPTNKVFNIVGSAEVLLSRALNVELLLPVKPDVFDNFLYENVEMYGCERFF